MHNVDILDPQTLASRELDVADLDKVVSANGSWFVQCMHRG